MIFYTTAGSDECNKPQLEFIKCICRFFFLVKFLPNRLSDILALAISVIASDKGLENSFPGVENSLRRNEKKVFTNYLKSHNFSFLADKNSKN